jgi:hypothetical protein
MRDTSPLWAARECAAYKLRNMRLTSEQRAALRAEVDRYDAEFLAAEAHAAIARRRHILRSALIFALLTAALWMGSAL